MSRRTWEEGRKRKRRIREDRVRKRGEKKLGNRIGCGGRMDVRWREEGKGMEGKGEVRWGL